MVITANPEFGKMLNQIKDLLQNEQLRDALRAARDKAEAVSLLLTTSAAKGHHFTVDGMSRLLADLTPADPMELSEGELLNVSGGLRAQGAHTGDVASCFG